MKIFKYKDNAQQFNSIYLLPLLLISLLGVKACLSNAKGTASKPLCEHSASVVNGKADYGVDVSSIVQNIGNDGVISIIVQLSTSEGTWERKQELVFEKDETKKLTYFFDEPTINTTNIQCLIEVYPNAHPSK